MITFYGDTMVTRAFLKANGLLERAENLACSNGVAGFFASVPGNKVAVVKCEKEGEDTELLAMHLSDFSEEEEDACGKWFFSVIDGGSLVGVSGEDFQA